MMKIFNPKNIMILGIMIFVLFSPSKTLAYEPTSICREISKVQSDIKKEQTKIRNEVNSAREKRSQDIKIDWAKRDEQFRQEQIRVDQMYKDFISILKSKAQSEEEIALVLNFEKELFALVAQSREKIDLVWQKYENDILLSLSKQDSLSETYFKEIETESQNRIGKLGSFCGLKNITEVKTEMTNIKKMKDRGLARYAFLRKSKLEINQYAETRNKNLGIIKTELSKNLQDLYNSLPEDLRN